MNGNMYNQVQNNQLASNQMNNNRQMTSANHLPSPQPKENSMVLEIILSFLYMFKLAYKAVYYPISTMSKKAQVNKPAETKKVNEEEYEGLSTMEIWDKKLKDLLGITKSENAQLEREKMELQEQLQDPKSRIAGEPKVYIYKVKDKNGKIITGRFTALSQMDVNSFLLNEGYEVFQIKNDKMIDFMYGQSSIIKQKWSTKDLTFWLTQLSTYIKAGIPLTDSIKILINQMGTNKNKKITMQSIAYELTMGNSFSNALEKQGGLFPSFLINMLRTAEATGDLEATLDEMIEYYTEMESTRKEMINALTYPVLVFIFAIGVTIFIILYVVPRFEGIYKSNNLEIKGVTKLVLLLSEFLDKYLWTLVLFIVIIVIVLYLLYTEVKAFRRATQVFLMKIPVIGDVIKYNELAIFTKTFSSLLKNNVFITDSIDILSKITNNEIYKEIMFETIDNITKGNKISEAFKDHWAVPDVAYYMIVTGESTGQLADMLDTVSHHYQEQHKMIVTTLKSLIEPIVIIFLAVIVGGIIIAVIVPMFDMYGQIS